MQLAHPKTTRGYSLSEATLQPPTKAYTSCLMKCMWIGQKRLAYLSYSVCYCLMLSDSCWEVVQTDTFVMKRERLGDILARRQGPETGSAPAQGGWTSGGLSPGGEGGALSPRGSLWRGRALPRQAMPEGGPLQARRGDPGGRPGGGPGGGRGPRVTPQKELEANRQKTFLCF